MLIGKVTFGWLKGFEVTAQFNKQHRVGPCKDVCAHTGVSSPAWGVSGAQQDLAWVFLSAFQSCVKRNFWIKGEVLWNLNPLIFLSRVLSLLAYGHSGQPWKHVPTWGGCPASRWVGGAACSFHEPVCRSWFAVSLQHSNMQSPASLPYCRERWSRELVTG